MDEQENESENGRIKRNLSLFVVGVLLLSTVGGWLLSNGDEVGGLVFVVSPFLVAALLRTFGGDGWETAGLRPKVRANAFWYALSLFAYPATFVIVLGVGTATGLVTVGGSLTSVSDLVAAGIVAQFVPRMAFAVTEEFGWRGYLDPQLAELGLSDLRRGVTVGLVWAAWHGPFVIATDYTDVALSVFLPLFTVGMVVAAVVYGQIRKYSRSVWPAVLMHGVANTVAWAVFTTDEVVFVNAAIAYLSPENVFTILLWAPLAAWLLRFEPGTSRLVRYPGRTGRTSKRD